MRCPNCGYCYEDRFGFFTGVSRGYYVRRFVKAVAPLVLIGAVVLFVVALR